MKKLTIWTILTFILCITSKTVAQDVEMDSTIIEAKKTKNDSIIAMAYSKLGFNYIFSNGEKALSTIDKGLEIATKSNCHYAIGNLKNSKGVYFQVNGLLDTAFIFHEDALQISEKYNFPNLKGLCLNNLGMVFWNKGENENALEYFLKALEHNKTLKDEKKQGSNLSNIGLIYQELGLIDKAIPYHEKALDIRKKNNNIQNLGISYNNLCICYRESAKFQTAIEYCQKAVNYCIQSENYIGLSKAYENLGNTYQGSKEYRKSIQSYKNAEEILAQLEIGGRSEIILCGNMAHAYNRVNDLQNAKKYSERGMELLSKNPEFQEFATALLVAASEVKFRTGEHLEGAKIINDWAMLTDSIFNSESAEAMANMQVKFETAEKEKQIALQEKENQEKQAKIDGRTRWIVGLIFGILALGFIGFLIYRQQITKRKGLEVANQLKDVIHQQKLQNELYEERLRISRDLHDNIGSQLTFISSSIDNIQYGNTDEQLNDKLSNIVDFTKSTTSQLRDTIWAMNKSGVTAKELESRIFNYVKQSDKIQNRTAITFENQLKNQDFALNAIQGMNCYRIIQEAINNSIKYAMAKSVKVLFQENGENIIVSIQDDGVGFEMTEIELGNGLKNMQYRAKEMGGTMEISSSTDSGTLIQLTIPKNTLKDV